LKDRLSEHLRRVKAGDTLLITDRGEVVAELSPPGHAAADPDVPPGLAALGKRGLATLAPRTKGSAYPTFRPGRGPSSRDLLDESRGSR